MNKLAQIKDSLLREHPELFINQPEMEGQTNIQLVSAMAQGQVQSQYVLSALNKIEAQIDAENQASFGITSSDCDQGVIREEGQTGDSDMSDNEDNFRLPRSQASTAATHQNSG